MVIGIVMVVIAMALLAPLAIEEARSNSITSQIEQAGGFVGSSQPPEWRSPVYDLVCRSDFFCRPYQLILEGSEISDETLSLAAQLKHLRVLELTDATIGSAQLAQLERMTQLSSLEFRNCILPEGGVERLRTALPEAKVESRMAGGQHPPGPASTSASPPDGGDS